jgi:hypothetical protein
MGDSALAVHGTDGHARDGGWRKSSYSMSNGHCVEAGLLEGGHVGVRDSQAAGGPMLRVGPGAWTAFVAGFRTIPPVTG